MTSKPRDESKRRLRPVTDQDLRQVAGGFKGKPGEYGVSSGGGGK